MSLKVWVLQHFGAIQDGHANFENNIKLLTGLINGNYILKHINPSRTGVLGIITKKNTY
jgi:hypothetical protein